MSKPVALPELFVRSNEWKDVVGYCAGYLQSTCNRMSTDIANQNMYALCSEAVNIKEVADILSVLAEKMSGGQKDATVI